MKVLSILLLFCISLGGDSKPPQSKGYTITGNIKNLSAKWVFMRIGKRDPKDNHPYWPKIDSAKVIDGKFILHKDTTLLDPAWSSNISYIDTISHKATGLKFFNPVTGKQHLDFILENTETLIEGDVNNKRGLSITGSKETDFLFRYGLISPTYIHELNPKIDSLKKAHNTIALNEAIKNKTEQAVKFKANFRRIIIENPSIHLGLINLYQNSKVFTPTELEELVKLFDPKLLKTGYGKNMLNYIQQSKLILPTQPFPYFSYNNRLQKKIELTNIKGAKGTIVVFWASWCVPCREEIPDLKNLYTKYHAKGINIVSISIDHNINDWKKALTQEKMPWPNLSNLPGDYKEISAKFNISGIPSIFLLDKYNKIILANVDFSRVEEKVKTLLNN